MLSIIQKMMKIKETVAQMFCILHTYIAMSTKDTPEREHCKQACYGVQESQNTQDILACFDRCVEKTKQDAEKILTRLTEQDAMKSYHECLSRHVDRGLDGSRYCIFPFFY